MVHENVGESEVEQRDEIKGFSYLGMRVVNF